MADGEADGGHAADPIVSFEPAIVSMKRAPKACDGVWTPGETSPKRTRLAIATLVSAVSA